MAKKVPGIGGFLVMWELAKAMNLIERPGGAKMRKRRREKRKKVEKGRMRSLRKRGACGLKVEVSSKADR